MTRKPIAFVPARGGSKRFPRKNVALLGKKPLLAWTVECARASGIFSHVLVSSEDEEILEIAARSGATLLRRPAHLAGDDVTIATLLLALIEARAFPEDATDVYLLLPTSPLRRPETIRRAWSAFVESGAPSLLSMVPVDYPPQWTLVLEGTRLRPFMPSEYEKPRSALARCSKHDGGHLIIKIDEFVAARTFMHAATIGFPVEREEAVDVDEPLDLAFAEFLIAQRTA